MVLAGNKAKRLSLVNDSAKPVHLHVIMVDLEISDSYMDLNVNVYI